eukprot:gene9901-34908_t
MSTHTAFADDEEAGGRRKVPFNSTVATGAGASAALPEAGKTSAEKKSKGKGKAARDFSSLLDEDVSYTPYVAPPEEFQASDGATADVGQPGDSGSSSMADMMGFAGFGKQVHKEEEQKAEVRLAMINAAKRGAAASDSEVDVGASGTPSSLPSIAGSSGGGAAAAASGTTNKGAEDDGEGDVLEAEDPFGIPVSHEANINHGQKLASALDIDPAGARLASGSYDWKVKFWDFAAMDARMASFRTIEPAEGCQVRCLRFSNSGDMVLVCTGNAQPMLVDRDGLTVLTCLKGDQYFNDLSKTYGHVAMVNDGKFHPKKKNIFATVSADSTVRIWDTDTTQLNHTLKSSQCGKCRTKQGKRAVCTSMAWNKDGSLLVVGCEGGSIQTFNVGSKTLIPKVQHYGAHDVGSTVTCVTFTRKGKRLLSRGTDGTVKLWNPKSLAKGPLKTASGLPCQYSMTDAVFSPNEKLIVTGTSGRDVAGTLVFLDAASLEQVQRVSVSVVGLIRIRWHPKINQIAVSTANGKVVVLYDARKSARGAKFCVAKAPRKANVLDALGVQSFGSVEGAIHAPHVHRKFREEEELRNMGAQRKRKLERRDGKKSMLPMKPVPSSGFDLGHQGRVQGFAPTLSMHIAKQTSYDSSRDEDPREAVLKYADAAAKDP